MENKESWEILKMFGNFLKLRFKSLPLTPKIIL